MSLVYLVRKVGDMLHEFFKRKPKVAPQYRQEQLATVKKAQTEDPETRQIDNWLGVAEKNNRVEVLLKGHFTGTRVVKMEPEEATRLQSEVESVEVIRDCTLDLIEPTKHAKKSPGSKIDTWHFKAVGLTEASRRKGYTGEGVTVCVLDTGIADVPDLKGGVIPGCKFNPEKFELDDLSSLEDTQGHGTHVAGLVAGAKTGVAPGAKVLNATMLPGVAVRLYENSRLGAAARGCPNCQYFSRFGRLFGGNAFPDGEYRRRRGFARRRHRE